LFWPLLSDLLLIPVRYDFFDSTIAAAFYVVAVNLLIRFRFPRPLELPSADFHFPRNGLQPA
jgi:hypothetical protein